MENNINLKDLWNTQPVPEVDQSALLKRVQKHKAAGLKKIFLLNGLLLGTILFVVFISIYFKPQLWTTKLGIFLTILPMVIALLFQNRMIPLYKKTDEEQSNADYLDNLLKIKSKEKTIQTTIMSVYFFLLSAGISLYMYEYTLLMPGVWALIAYGIVSIWIGFNWFVLRPKVIKKNQEKTDELIRQFEKIKCGLSNPTSSVI
ncbi:MAG: hypothetical protein ABIW47_01325 [Ginsengibacter sp.]|jgi:hypothetical protein